MNREHDQKILGETNTEKILLPHHQTSVYTVSTHGYGSNHNNSNHTELLDKSSTTLTPRFSLHTVSDMAHHLWRRMRQGGSELKITPFPLRNNSDDDDDEPMSTKIQCKNMNSHLAQQVGMRHYNNHSHPALIPWKPPLTHGLNNGRRIIPEYYLKTNMKDNNLLVIDYPYIILDDVRNLRPLNAYQLKYIQEQMSEEEKQRIIVEFNQVIFAYSACLLDDMHPKN